MVGIEQTVDIYERPSAEEVQRVREYIAQRDATTGGIVVATGVEVNPVVQPMVDADSRLREAIERAGSAEDKRAIGLA